MVRSLLQEENKHLLELWQDVHLPMKFRYLPPRLLVQNSASFYRNSASFYRDRRKPVKGRAGLVSAGSHRRKQGKGSAGLVSAGSECFSCSCFLSSPCPGASKQPRASCSSQWKELLPQLSSFAVYQPPLKHSAMFSMIFQKRIFMPLFI